MSTIFQCTQYKRMHTEMFLWVLLPHCGLSMWQVALSDLDVAVYDADILVFVVPYQYIHEVCDKLRGKVKSTAIAVSLVKVNFPTCLLQLYWVCFLADRTNGPAYAVQCCVLRLSVCL